MVKSGRVPEKGPGEYRKRVESGRVPEKCEIRVSTEKSVKSGRVSEKGPGEYRKMVE